MTHCQVFLNNSHYALGFVARYCVGDICPRLFAAGKPLPQGYLFKMRIAAKVIFDWIKRMNKISIMFANKFFFLNGGSERVFFQDRDFLLRNGTKVVDFSMKDPRNFPSDCANYFVSNIDYYSTRGVLNKIKQGVKFVRSAEAINKLQGLIENEKPDIAHLHNIYHQLTPSIISVLKRNGVRVVLTLHDGKLICPSYLMLAKGKVCTTCEGRSFWRPLVTNCVGSRRQEVLLMLEAYWHKWARSYEYVDIFLSPSRFLAKLVSQRIPESKIRVLHNGIDLDAYSSGSSDHAYALYFGRLSREKGIETLLKTHSMLGNEMPLKVVGAGPLEKGLRERYPNAEFLGYQAGDVLKETIANSAFVVVPSEWYENCSMVVLEAMAMGKSVIGSRIGGIPEQIDEGKTGFLFEMGNVGELAAKMKALFQYPDMRRTMGMAARKKAEQEYSLDAHCTTLLKIYKELLSENYL